MDQGNKVHTAIQYYIEGRPVPTPDRTLVVNFVYIDALSACTLSVTRLGQLLVTATSSVQTKPRVILPNC